MYAPNPASLYWISAGAGGDVSLYAPMLTLNVSDVVVWVLALNVGGVDSTFGIISICSEENVSTSNVLAVGSLSSRIVLVFLTLNIYEFPELIDIFVVAPVTIVVD